MTQQQIYTEDLEIARSLIKRDGKVTRQYYYEQCYPLFKSIYDNYYTDCKCCKEFMDEIYVVVLAPSKITGKCQMENFKGESTLRSWLRTVCLYYCYEKYGLKKVLPPYEPLPVDNNGDEDGGSDRTDKIYGSTEIDFSAMNRADVETLLSLMSNSRYRRLIRLRYLEQRTNEETAKILGMSMENYYNVHLRAKAQYDKVCRKEEAKYV